ncbi:MAG: putative lipid II flippase FtsW [Actinomycetales bacterium]|nr:putative lipid II flippase FtsW [Actinomycetales bacterium]
MSEGLRSRLDSPLVSYYLVLGSTMALTIVGLVMVLSSSSIEALRLHGNSFSVFTRQVLFAALAVPLVVLAVKMPVSAWKAVSWPLLVSAVLGLLLVLTPLGKGVHGNRNWLEIAGMRLQPSEFAKLALVIWAATVLARKRKLLEQTVHVVVPVVFPVAMLLVGLVLLGHDLGTAMVLMALAAALLWVAGTPARLFLGGLALAVTATGIALASPNKTRLARIEVWLSRACEDMSNYHSTCWQSVHAKWALASGGWWGVGLGGSREKWSYLPEAHNDFIFAIIGEELGLTGTLVVLVLFAVLGVGLLRVVARSRDPFVKIATGGVLAWVLGQAIINIGAVLGLLPVIGVPLPLVSSGGSALVTTLVALGMVIGFARREPGVPEALAARVGVVRRSLAVLPGRRPANRRTGGTR